MRFIGITGGIGAGKSEILQYIRKHYKCEIYLADEVAHLVKEPGTKCFVQLVELLGQDIIAADGEIDKAVMAATPSFSISYKTRERGISTLRIRVSMPAAASFPANTSAAALAT